jgi:hypothetical protein
VGSCEGGAIWQKPVVVGGMRGKGSDCQHVETASLRALEAASPGALIQSRRCFRGAAPKRSNPALGTGRSFSR